MIQYSHAIFTIAGEYDHIASVYLRTDGNEPQMTLRWHRKLQSKYL